MLDDWLYVGIFFVIAMLLPAVAIAMAGIVAPKKPNKIKQTTYECGVETVGDTWVQFKVQYYIFALVFLIFDVETVFLFPWAVAYGELTLFGVVEAVIFVIILFAALVYVWRKGALEWV